MGRRPQGRRGAGSPARVRGCGGQPERSTGSATTLGSLSYRRGIFAPSTCRVHAVTWHNVALAKWQLVRRAWCELCRSTERVQKYTDGTGPWSVCWPTPSDPPCSQDRPKLTHTRVPRTALACCLGATAATLISNRADARALAACSALLASRRVRAGLTRRHRTRSRWAADTASRRGYARAASHSPQGHRSPPARGPCRQLKPRSCPRFAPTPYRVRGSRPCSRRPAPRR